MNYAQIKTELQFKAVRSSGAGGQNVNKVATKVQLQFHIENSYGLSSMEKTILLKKLSNRISQEGILQIDSDETRSQLRNKELSERKLFSIIENMLRPEKKRIPTKISRAAIRKRLENKRYISEKKENRKLKF